MIARRLNLGTRLDIDLQKMSEQIARQYHLDKWGDEAGPGFDPKLAKLIVNTIINLTKEK
jgi:hypothetical protein